VVALENKTTSTENWKIVLKFILLWDSMPSSPVTCRMLQKKPATSITNVEDRGSKFF
jgi:hypothetical protein